MAVKPAWSTKTRIFPNAGRLTLITHEADGSDTKDPSKIYTSDMSIVDSITTKYSTTSEDMNDGNSFDPAATHITGRVVEVAIVMNTHDPELYRFATSAEQVTINEDAYITKIGEEYVIDKDGKVLLAAESINPDGICIVRDAAGADYEKVDADPEEGQYSVDAATATLTFNALDKGKAVIVTAEYAAEVLTTQSVESQPKQNVYKLIVDGKNTDKDEKDELADNFIVDACKIKGDIQPPARQKNYSSVTYTFGLVKPRAGAKAFTMATAKVKERTVSGASTASETGSTGGYTDP